MRAKQTFIDQTIVSGVSILIAVGVLAYLAYKAYPAIQAIVTSVNAIRDAI